MSQPVAAHQCGQQDAVLSAIEGIVQRRGRQFDGLYRIRAGPHHLREVADAGLGAGPIRLERLGIVEEIGQSLADVGHDCIGDLAGSAR